MNTHELVRKIAEALAEARSVYANPPAQKGRDAAIVCTKLEEAYLRALVLINQAHVPPPQESF